MSKERSDHLYVLIKSLRKSEKRYFKVRNNESESGNTKYLRLFDAFEKMEVFGEERLIKENKWISPGQFSNLKAHLYKKILQSLKEYTASSNMDINLREQIDHIQILFDRSLYQQSMNLLQKTKKALQKSDNLELQLEILKWEKNLLPYSLGKQNEKKVSQIVDESNAINNRISKINLLTNLSVELNAIYLRTGYIRSKEDFEHIRDIFTRRLPKWDENAFSFREQLLWYDIHLNYYNFIQDWDQAYAFAKKWVGLFSQTPGSAFYMEMYLKGLNHLLNTQSRLLYYDEFKQTHKQLRKLAKHRLFGLNENLQIRLFKYSYAHQFNGYFMVGEFHKGVQLLNRIESRLEGFIGVLDKHSELILYYKIACLYFGAGKYRGALKWLNRIINSEDQDIREDVHSFARIINLITHYELGNQDVIDYYVKSTFRFLSKKDDLHDFQKHILDFLKALSREMTDDQLVTNFKTLREKLLVLANSEYDKRAFVYFDIISWLESKIEQRPTAEIIREKGIKNIRKAPQEPVNP